MSAAKNKAVFLSYASQDAAAVLRIAEALRASGVEVWFDQNELVGGDAWDAKIRGQIASCALFVPVISANTQARLEGYFRIEWKLAARRTHGMATAKAFLLPVVIDDTRDAEAHVPDEFREVQWTRLPDGETPGKFCERVQALLRGGAMLQPAAEPSTRGVKHLATSVPARRWLFPVAVGLAVVAAVAVWRPWLGGEKSSRPATVAALELSEAAKLVADARRIYMGPFTRDDLVLAESFAKKATELEPRLAAAWAARAWTQAGYILRGFATGEALRQRANDAQSFANQALAIDRNNVEALLALAQNDAWRRNSAQAEARYRRARELEPRNVVAARLLSILLRSTERVPEAVALMKSAVQDAPGDPLARLDLAIAYSHGWNFAKAWEELDAALALGPFPGALLRQAQLAIRWKGDPVLMRRLIEGIDPAYRGEDDAVGADLSCALAERRLDAVQAAARRTSRVLFEESTVYSEPKAWFLALAYEQDGKPNLARAQWEEAEAVLRERLRAEPTNQLRHHQLAVTLAWLGRIAEAKAESDPLEAVWREQLNPGTAHALAYFYAACGDVPKTVAYLRQTLNRGLGSSALTPHELRLDPSWMKVRADPEFQALLANPPALPAPVEGATETAVQAVEAKSVAVLAFKNLSGDPGREFFSDGLSEAVTDVLGRVPGLKVVGSASAFSFKGKAVSIPEMARQLGVTHLVEGTVLQEGATVRITAKLIKADGFQVWVSDKLERESKNIFALHDEVAGLIAKQLSLKLGVSSASASVNPQAFELYVQARQQWNLRTIDSFNRAEDMLNRALVLEPNFARAHAALGDVWNNRAQDTGAIGAFGDRNSPELGRIGAKAREALALDPNSVEAHALLGSVFAMGWQSDEAARELRLAITLNPTYASAHQRLGRVLLNDGRVDEGLAELKLAAEFDPLSSRILDNYARALRHAGRFTESLTAAQRAIAVQPGSFIALTAKSRALLALGRTDEAVAVARGLKAETDYQVWALVDMLAGAGRQAEAEALLAQVKDSSWRWFALASLGRRADSVAAFDAQWLAFIQLTEFLFEPSFDPIRGDPHIVQGLAALGLTEAHARAQAWRAAHPPEKPRAKP